jgi:hypothetical protein
MPGDTVMRDPQASANSSAFAGATVEVLGDYHVHRGGKVFLYKPGLDR